MRRGSGCCCGPAATRRWEAAVRAADEAGPPGAGETERNAWFRTWKRPVAGDGGCTSDRASRTVTRDRWFANSIVDFRTPIDRKLWAVVTGVTPEVPEASGPHGRGRAGQLSVI
ncbi:hypothetical protein San01_32770 [Streptomyces angustmyceticus]|uniref:Uncharacterized protein n=1 Tax=Streptomyces angustmyceticus TaxID=285578 RepID=A0A5J4LGX7_9ACTN|nr:hypothetical protein San01_32770 [Streptomyces angustmyceticus]